MSRMRELRTLDSLSPDESDLPPSARVWAREVYLPLVSWPLLELRDPNDGRGDPAGCTRHQYLVGIDNRLWTRRLPPAQLDAPADETSWRDDPAAGEWVLCIAGPESSVWEWSGCRPQVPADADPRAITVRDTIDGGETYQDCPAWAMPPRHPTDAWAAITGAPCPVHGCGQTLVWYEAGYVPGYRVCMAADRKGGFVHRTLRHRFGLRDPWILVQRPT